MQRFWKPGAIGMAMMKAVTMSAYGEPEVLTYAEVQRPEPQENEVLVRVHAASINPVDWKTRAGKALASSYGTENFPLIIGWDLSGVVVEVGSEVTDLSVGAEVYGMVRFPKAGGAYAEYVASPAAHLAKKPKSIDHLHAAALPLVSLTAWQALFEGADLAAGQTILIQAAAGGVGHIAVQLAKWRGAHVIGTGSERNAEFLRSIGVDTFIDYHKVRFEDAARDVDIVLEAIGGEILDRSFAVLKPGGKLVSILGIPSEELAARYGVQTKRVFVHQDAGQLAEIARLVDEGKVKPAVDRVFPLRETAQAHAMGELGRTRGKIVLQV